MKPPIIGLALWLSLWPAGALGAAPGREHLRLDEDWRFALGSAQEPAKDFNFDPAHPEAAVGPARADFDDRDWRRVDLPHDFVVEGAFDPRNDVSHGFLAAGVGWYRKQFVLPARDRGRSLWLDFDGVYRDSLVWLNGKFLGRHASGYTSFRYDIGAAARYGGTNDLVVRADAHNFEGWWYEGGGIYRHVWLTKADPLHIVPWGVFVNSLVSAPLPAEEGTALVTAKTWVTNGGSNEAPCEVETVVQSATGQAVARASARERIPAGADIEVSQGLRLETAKYWSIESPYLYRLVSTVRRQGRVVDRVETPFGIRTFRFDARQGFFLNGKPVKLKGTCNHQDFAGVGVAMPDQLYVDRVRQLKEMGSNAYRCSHNPPTPALLEACDTQGMLVMDENRHLGDSPEVLGQVESMVLRDRNHPSIILWSLCNEEREQGSELGQRMGQAMKDVIHRLDPTRPVTAAMNGGYGKGLSLLVDVQGFNYHSGDYDGYHQSHPLQPLFGSETASTVSTRARRA